LSVSEACDAILREITPLPATEVTLLQALGRVLAEDVASPLALPAWDNASMDGYAVRADDIRGASAATPRPLRVIATIAAGGTASRRVNAGEAARIMTGAPLPEGADSVVRVEDTDAGKEMVHISSDRDALRNIRPRGEDVARGAVAVGRGEQLYPGHLGLFAAIGRARVSVVRRPRVGVLASGDELVDVDRFDEVMAGHRIVSSNSYALAAAVRAEGADVIPLGIAPDDPTVLRDRIASAECDLLITTGGVSVGDFDHTRRVIGELGGEKAHRFWRVRIRPGAPLGFGVVRDTPWLGLPGNPVSALVTFELFARPAIRRLAGHRLVHRRPTPVRVEQEININAPLTHFLRAVVRRDDDGHVARLTGPQGSGLMSSMALANALLIVPPERPQIAPGEVVAALLLRDDLAHAEEPPAA
jgi:molybdopterin molybdotransferase